MRLNPYSFFRKFWSKDHRVQSIWSPNKLLTTGQHLSTPIVVLENFDQKTICFKPYSVSEKF